MLEAWDHQRFVSDPHSWSELKCWHSHRQNVTLLLQSWSKQPAAVWFCSCLIFFPPSFLQNLRHKPTQSSRITSLVLLTFLNRICPLNQQDSGSKHHMLITCHLVWSIWTRSWIFLNVGIVLFSLQNSLIPRGMGLFFLGRGAGRDGEAFLLFDITMK